MTDKSANKMWGGRFSMSPAEIMEEINASIGFDKVLAPQDIRGSKAHAAMLAEAGIITKTDAREIAKGLDQVLSEIENGSFNFSRALEDVHMNAERRLRTRAQVPSDAQPARSSRPVRASLRPSRRRSGRDRLERELARSSNCSRTARPSARAAHGANGRRSELRSLPRRGG